jgi:hypothetical protein
MLAEAEGLCKPYPLPSGAYRRALWDLDEHNGRTTAATAIQCALRAHNAHKLSTNGACDVCATVAASCVCLRCGVAPSRYRSRSDSTDSVDTGAGSTAHNTDSKQMHTRTAGSSKLQRKYAAQGSNSSSSKSKLQCRPTVHASSSARTFSGNSVNSGKLLRMCRRCEALAHALQATRSHRSGVLTLQQYAQQRAAAAVLTRVYYTYARRKRLRVAALQVLVLTHQTSCYAVVTSASLRSTVSMMLVCTVM